MCSTLATQRDGDDSSLLDGDVSAAAAAAGQTQEEVEEHH